MEAIRQAAQPQLRQLSEAQGLLQLWLQPKRPIDGCKVAKKAGVAALTDGEACMGQPQRQRARLQGWLSLPNRHPHQVACRPFCSRP